MKNINYIIIGILEVLLFSRPNQSFAQKIITFYESDSISDKYICTPKLMEGKIFGGLSPIDFCQKLPDGEYVCRGVNNFNDTAGSYVMMTGTFKDSLREGPFIYYSEPDSIGMKARPEIVYNYSKGLLNGYYVSYLGNNIGDEGYYVMGRRHGFFVSYDYNGNLHSIKVYKHDTLTNWVEYSSHHTIFSSGYGRDSQMSGEYRHYYRNGNLFIQAYIERGTIRQFTEYFQSGKIKFEGEGVFEQSQSIDPFYFIKGILKEYNEAGVLINTQKK